MGHAEGDYRSRTLHHQDQDHRSPREEVLRLDRWLHPCLPVYLPADVDLQAVVRRVRTLHCPPQVLLSAQQQQQQLPSAVVTIVKPSTSYCYSLLAYSSQLQSLMKQLTLSQGEKLYIYIFVT